MRAAGLVRWAVTALAPFALMAGVAQAQTGADLLDIGGKVRYISVNSTEDGVTELASITDPEQVAVLVELVLGAPVDQSRQDYGVTQYFIAFHLRDGTIVSRSYSPRTCHALYKT